MQSAKGKEREKQHKAILEILDTETHLRSKKELIERFIAEQLGKIPKNQDVGEVFEQYWTEEKKKAIAEMSHTEGLAQAGLEKLIGDYLFTEKAPLRDDVLKIMKERPRIKERKSVIFRIIDKIKVFVETFIDGVD